MKCYRRLINIQHNPVSGLCRVPIFSYLPKSFTQFYGDATLVYQWWDTNMAAENQQKLTKKSDFHCGDKNAFFLLVSSLTCTWTHFVLLKMYKPLKIIRRELFFNQTSLPRLPLSRTVKIRKFKMLYFQNERRYGAGTSTKICFSVTCSLVYIRIQRVSLFWF